MSAQRRPPDVDDEFLTVAEVAAILKLNQQTIRNWIDQVSLAALRVACVGRRVRVPCRVGWSRSPSPRTRWGTRSLICARFQPDWGKPNVRVIGGGRKPVPVGCSVRHAAPPAYPTTNNPLTPKRAFSHVWSRT
jgi:excisionase family DNA binding protein